jgi:hypothetical protein
MLSVDRDWRDRWAYLTMRPTRRPLLRHAPLFGEDESAECELDQTRGGELVVCRDELRSPCDTGRSFHLGFRVISCGSPKGMAVRLRNVSRMSAKLWSSLRGSLSESRSLDPFAVTTLGGL